MIKKEDLVNYFRENKAKGYSEQQIKDFLVSRGFNENEIVETMNSSESNSKVSTNMKSRSKVIPIIIFMILAIGILVFAPTFFKSSINENNTGVSEGNADIDTDNSLGSKVNSNPIQTSSNSSNVSEFKNTPPKSKDTISNSVNFSSSNSPNVQSNSNSPKTTAPSVTTTSCTDGILNQNEMQIDCGGQCPACECSSNSTEICLVPNGSGVRTITCVSNQRVLGECIFSSCDFGFIWNGTVCIQNISINPAQSAPAKTYYLEYIENVAASNYDVSGGNLPELSVDGNLSPSMRWSGEGNGVWIRYDFKQEMTWNAIEIFFYKSNLRTNNFTLEYYSGTWIKLGDYVSSGSSVSFETFSFAPITTKHFRVVGHGNSEAAMKDWTSIIEVRFKNDICTPNCAGKTCGDNGCGGICGTCTTGYTCNSGTCTAPTPTCTPNCAGKTCGSDGCSGTCGTCTTGYTCNSGTCITTTPTCTPNCSGKTCGDNGCGGICGTCNNGYTCSNNQCTAPTPTCTPNCAGKTCGSDGCSGTCGTCTTGYTCNSGTCTAPPTAPQSTTGNTYYVSTTGNDGNSGNSAQPWRTWQKAFNTAQSGDIVYIRGGVYSVSGSYASGHYNGAYVNAKSGTSSNRIKIFAYPGETPILDCSSITQSGLHVCLAFENADYWHLKGLTIRNTPAAVSGAWSAVGFNLASSDNNIIENFVSYGHSGPGIAINGDGNQFINTDSHSNYDVLEGGENADGFIIGHTHQRYTNTFKGCRSYNNSDDGYDSYGFEGVAIYENCWAFNNGYGSSGDGAGFKLGMTELTPLPISQKVIKNCIAYNSKGDGFDQSDGNVTIEIYNSIAYKMGSVGFLMNNGENTASIFKNNIQYQNRWAYSFQSNMIVQNNSWQNGITVSDSDFVSVDGSQLLLPRKSDGSLPDITFLKLRSDSDLLNRGANVGLPYSGSAPDIGPFEFTGTVSAPTCTPNCNGKTCGTDGCDGSCGTCSNGYTCTGGTCIAPTPTAPQSTTGNTYYISPSGSDTTGNGSIERPWFTLTKAWPALSPGDTLYLRGGTYRYSAKQTLTGRNGLSGKMINIWAYPGEHPIFTDADTLSTGNFPPALIVLYGDYFHWKGLEIAYVEQTATWSGAGSMVAYNSDNNIFEQFNVHHCVNGFEIRGSSTGNLVLNGDFHHNNDPYVPGTNGVTPDYGDADGLAIDFNDAGTTNTIRGCRMWWNSDDGIDLYKSEGNVIIENSWAWYNGFAPDTFAKGGDGNGFKLGLSSTPTSEILRTVTNSLSVYNKKWGFQDNGALGNMKIYNNIAYKNCYQKYDSWCGGFTFQASGVPYYIKNNIAYANLGTNTQLGINTNIDHNSWNLGVSVTDADFESIDIASLDDPRKSDGSLPDITFLHLASDSDLIDKGVNVGLPYSGNAPDLGVFEN